MNGGFFYIEYADGKVTEIEFKNAKMAKRAYDRYAKCPEDNARGYGWDTKYEKPTLTQQIRVNKINKV